MYTSISGQAAVEYQLRVIANNLANMNTSGFKAEKLKFEQLMPEAQMLSEPLNRDASTGSRKLTTDSYVEITGGYTDFASGPVEISSNPLDLAIDGNGFFVVQTPEGERYTRAGDFSLDGGGRLVTASGYPVLGDGGELVVPNGVARFDDGGRLLSNGESVGRIRIVELETAQLTREPGQLFRSEGGSVTTIENPKVISGAVEASNVNAVRELTDLIQASKLFESLAKTQESSSRMTRARNEAFKG